MNKTVPRLMITGTGSGCGKTTVTCAILQALKNRGYDVMSYKCGPDYIDPMFHSKVIGTDAGNIDLFFADEETAKYLFAKHASELNIIEGAMGYYDGASMESVTASAFHVSQTLDAPSILVINGRGMGLSIAAVVKGYQTFRQESRIEGVILNNVSPMTYPRLKECIERECGIKVFGFLPVCPECVIESRHLGLVTAAEIDGLKKKLAILAENAEKTIDLDDLVELMRKQKPVEYRESVHSRKATVKIAVAMDKAFCFYYRDNLELLEELGAELLPFSPLNDNKLPECDGLILGGGYPELYAEQLSRNDEMLEAIRTAVETGIPTIAECGGFMYLTNRIAQAKQTGAINTECENKGRLVRFGYVDISSDTDSLLFEPGMHVRGHEFHYWDASDPGNALTATKLTGKAWKCGFVSETMYAGYPHLYFYSNPGMAERFIAKCAERRINSETNGN